MPLVIYKRSNRTHAVLPINLKITTSLIISLIYLQILYLVSFLAKPFWSSAGEFPPFKHNIERWERTIIDIIIAIVPFSNYRSPNPSAILHSDALLHRSHNTTYSTASHVNLDGIPLMPPKAASSAFVYPVTIPQCYPGTAIEGMTPVMAMTERSDLKLDLKGGGIGTATAPGSTITKPGPVMDRYGRNGDPVYETVKKPVPGSGSKSRSPGGSWHRTGINTSGTGSGSGTGTGTGIVTSAGVGNTPVLGSQHSPQHTPSRSRTQSQSHATKSTPSPPPPPRKRVYFEFEHEPIPNY
ncbi:hypothetical protein N7478_006482 [Penicillium angulare]|uniref:uncharacterized protein n=1 Tax=Penicillium angulare TaxID=116970 RepID=UPI002540B4CE|nr:uncharacterized protein N7478_006482 [Penicillium angulare]KAJ5281110.1 hypothetical protein N7478_006482 [Penicillium angulare]